MNPITEKHEEAMDLAELAFIARIKGKNEDFLELSRQAYELEAEAANTLLTRFEDEPSRSILYRSAASLAMQCHKFREAEQLIGLGLGGNAPSEIAQELRILYDQLKFNRKLVEQNLDTSGKSARDSLDITKIKKFSGLLVFADFQSDGKSTIKIRNQKDKIITFIVPSDLLMSLIVSTLWEIEVEVFGTSTENNIFLLQAIYPTKEENPFLKNLAG